jgi:hypothetical protein
MAKPQLSWEVARIIQKWVGNDGGALGSQRTAFNTDRLKE